MEGPQIIIIIFLWKLWLSRRVWIYWRPLEFLVTLVTTVSITKVCNFFLLQIKIMTVLFFRQIRMFFFSKVLSYDLDHIPRLLRPFLHPLCHKTVLNAGLKSN